jgi:hypothetical protein
MSTRWLILVAYLPVLAQFGIGMWLGITGLEVGRSHESRPSASEVYTLVSGAFVVSALVSSKLASILAFQEGRIRRLEQLVGQSPPTGSSLSGSPEGSGQLR